MTENEMTLTTVEYSELTGMSIATITQLLRQGKLHGEKRCGKWAIYHSARQEMNQATSCASNPPNGTTGATFDNPPPAMAKAEKSYDVKTFAQLTYLTENGVQQWLKIGRLSGSTDAGGQVLVDAANLDRPELQHLLRK